MVKYFIYDYNQYKLFDIGFDTKDQAFDFCLGKFKTDEEMEDIIILLPKLDWTVSSVG